MFGGVRMSKDQKLYSACVAILLGTVLFCVVGVPVLRAWSFHRFLRRSPSCHWIAESLTKSGVAIKRPRYLEYNPGGFDPDTRILLRFEISESEFPRFISAADYTRGEDSFTFWHEPPSWWQPTPGRVEVYTSRHSGLCLAYDRVGRVAYFIHPQT